MPLPLAHTVVGYSVTSASGIRFRKQARIAVLFSLVVANLPDIDFLPGALANEPTLYHRGIAHTFPAAIFVALIVAGVLTRFGPRFREIFLLGFLVYASHLLADTVNFGGGNAGIKLLWPFSNASYALLTPWAGMRDSPLVFHRGRDSAGFAESFLSFAFLRALVLQALIFSPLLIPARWIRSKRSLQGKSGWLNSAKP